MEKIENLFYSNLISLENNIIKLINNNSKENTSTKFHFSRNLLLKNKNKTSSNFNIYKNPNLSDYNFIDTPNKKEELFKSDINQINNKKTVFENSFQFEQNFMRKKNYKNNTSEIFSAKSCDKKIYPKIINRLNLSQIKKRKIDYIKNKSLLKQKNYYKKLFRKEELESSSNYSRKINSFLGKIENKYNNIDKLIKYYLEQDNSNAHFKKNKVNNFSISSYKNFDGYHTKKNNYNIIKIKKCNSPNIIKSSNYLLLDNKNNIRSKINYSIKKSKENKENKKNEEHNGNYKLNENDKIIDDNYNEYLKGIITSSESNKSKSEKNIIIQV